MSARRVVLLAGGRSSEHDVSLESARSVAAALAGLGIETATIEIGREGGWQLAAGALPALPPQGSPMLDVLEAAGTVAGRDAALAGALGAFDVVFPLVHGPNGEDGTLQGLLELAGLPYVGAGVTASALAMDKDLFKAVLRDRGIPVARHLTLRAGEAPGDRLAYPVFVKPARLGSSIGISKAHDAAELERSLALAFRHDEKVLVEEFVDGVEVEVGVLGNLEPVVSEPGEIVVTANEWYDYEAKYAPGAMDLVLPARISPAQRARARELARAAFAAIECEGMARVDLFVRRSGEVLVNELNTIPGFTATSVYAKLFEAAGVGYPALLERLLELALERHARRSRLDF